MINSSTDAINFEEDNGTLGNFADNSQIPQEVTIFLISWGMSMIPGIIFGNTLVMIAYCKFIVIKEEVSNIFIMSLAVTDMGCAITSLPLYIARKLTHMLGTVAFGQTPAQCYAAQIFIILPLGSSIATLMMIAINRAIAIGYPLRYQALMTKKICWALVICAQLYTPLVMSISLLVSVFIMDHSMVAGTVCRLETLMHPKAAAFGTAIAMYAPMMVTYAMHFYAVGVATKQQRSIASETLHVNEDRRHQYRILRTMSRILGLFTLCFLPLALLKTLAPAYPTSPWWHHMLNDIFLDLLYMNSLFNPIVYAVSDSLFRKAFKKLLNCQQS